MQLLQVQTGTLDTSPHFVTYRAAGSVTWRPCPPTLPWLSDPQRGCTLDTCVETEVGVKVLETRRTLHAAYRIDKYRHVFCSAKYATR